MFVPVACSACGKPFQVPDAAVGKPAACPWCQAAVVALPLGTPVASDDEPAVVLPAPLSLDDEAPPARRRLGPVFLVVLVAVVATLATVGLLRRKEGYLVSREWRPFTAPDNSCAVDLLGRPAEDADAPETGQRRYVSEGWYSGITTWVGWRNLSAAEAQAATSAEAWHSPPVTRLFDAERDWMKGTFGGYVTKDATTQFQDPLTREVRLELPRGRAVGRMIVRPTGPRPRIYFLGIAGPRLDTEGAEAKRLFDSFRVID
jgi:hypothetical protein